MGHERVRLIFDINLYFVFFGPYLPFYSVLNKKPDKESVSPLISCKILYSLKNYADGGQGWGEKCIHRWL